MHEETRSRRLLAFGGAAVSAIFFAGMLSVTLGLISLAKSLWPMVWGHDFAGEPFWQFIRLDGAPHKLFNLDRVWWLLFIGPGILAGLATGLSDFLEWLMRSPEERAAARERRAKLESERVQKEQQRREEAKRLRKEKSKPMSGWRRLWIVLSIVLGIPVFAIAYDDRSRIYTTLEPNQYVQSLQGQEFWDALFEQSLHEERSTRSCLISTVRMESFGQYYSVSCERDPTDVIIEALLLALIPGLFMLLVGLTIRWIYRGFKPQTVT